MSAVPVVLFDLSSRPPNKTWSLNPWKTRLLLNYKGLNYKTEWLEYPNIKPTLENHVPANADGAAYTIPAVRFADGTYMQDSRKIAAEIEKRFPSPSAHLDTPYLPRLEQLIAQVRIPLFPDMVNKIPTRLLNEVSTEYWHQTRPARFGGRAVDQVEREDGGAQSYKGADPHVRAIAKMLQENPAGPFFEGGQVTYADFVWVGFLRWVQRVGNHEFEQLIASDREVHEKLLAACQPWLARDDH